MAIGWFCVCVVLAITLGCVLLVGLLKQIDRGPTQIDPEKFVYPIPTPSPTPYELDYFFRYGVPLDDELQIYIEEMCLEKRVDTAVVMAVIDVESGCDPNMVSDNGNSWGLMQIYATEHTARCVRLGAWNLLDPYQNVRVGIDYLSELLSNGHGIEWALSWYNGHGGEPCEYADKVLTEAERLMESVQIVVKD